MKATSSSRFRWSQDLQGKRKLLSFAVAVGGAAFLGLQVANGRGVVVLVALVAAGVFAFTLTRSLGHLVGLVIGWVPFVGDLVLVDFGDLPDVTVSRIVLVAVIVLCLQRASTQVKGGLPTNRYLTAITWAVYLAVPFLLQAAIRAIDVGNALRHLLDSYLIPFFCFVAAGAVAWDSDELDGAMRLLLTGGMGWLALALIEFVTGRSLYSGIDYVGLNRGYIRPAGPFSSPTALGWAAGAVAVAGLAWVLSRRGGRLGAIGTAGSLASTIVTLTRSAWLGVGLAFIYVITKLGTKSKWRLIAMTAIGAVVVAFMLQAIGSQALTERAGNEGTIFNRLSIYATAWGLFADQPLIGIGLTNFRFFSQSALAGFGDIPASYAANVLAPHNSALLVLVESGIISALLLGFVVYVMLKSSLVASRLVSEHSERWPIDAFVGLLIVSAANGIALDLQLHAQAAYVVGLLGGLLYGAAFRKIRSEGLLQ